ncbi:MAG: glycosyltransferase, partial [Rhodopila sp.]
MNDDVLTENLSVDALIADWGSAGTCRRILHLAKHVGYGNGSVHVAVDLACVQAAAGHDVTFVSGGGTFVDLLVSQGVNHVTLAQDHKRLLAALTSLRQLIGLVRARRPDVIHAHMMGSAVLGYGASLACGAPLVTTVHNSF